MQEESLALHTEEDMEAILKIAVRNEPADHAGRLRERLERAANELGLTPQALAEAEAVYAKERAAALAAERKASARREFRASRLRAFYHHLASYAAVNAGLVTLNLVSSGRPTWSLWVLAGWGIGLLSDAADTFFSDLRDERKFERWHRRRVERGEA